MSNILQQPKTVFKRQGHGDVFAKIQSLANAQPDLTTGELEKALEASSFARDCAQALIAKGECPVYLPQSDRMGCRFNTNGCHRCGYNEVK